jgi:hypothetical protein
MSTVDFLRISAWSQCVFLGFSLSLGAYSQPAPPNAPSSVESELIEATGHPEICFLTNGMKYHIESPSWFKTNGYDPSIIHLLTPSEVDAIPTGYPLPEGAGLPGKPGASALEGTLLLGTDGKIYVVMHGKKHWILDSLWIAESRYAGKAVLPLTEGQLAQVPLGADILYQTLTLRRSWLNVLCYPGCPFPKLLVGHVCDQIACYSPTTLSGIEHL